MANDITLLFRQYMNAKKKNMHVKTANILLLGRYTESTYQYSAPYRACEPTPKPSGTGCRCCTAVDTEPVQSPTTAEPPSCSCPHPLISKCS